MGIIEDGGGLAELPGRGGTLVHLVALATGGGVVGGGGASQLHGPEGVFSQDQHGVHVRIGPGGGTVHRALSAKTGEIGWAGLCAAQFKQPCRESWMKRFSVTRMAHREGMRQKRERERNTLGIEMPGNTHGERQE